MARGNDGHHTQNWPYPRVAGQDRTHFRLGTSDAKPARGYQEDYEKAMQELFGDQWRKWAPYMSRK
jgi:hypothetical protein